MRFCLDFFYLPSFNLSPQTLSFHPYCLPPASTYAQRKLKTDKKCQCGKAAKASRSSFPWSRAHTGAGSLVFHQWPCLWHLWRPISLMLNILILLSCRASPMHKENLRILDLTKYFEAVGQSPTQNDKCFYQTHSALRIWSYFFKEQLVTTLLPCYHSLTFLITQGCLCSGSRLHIQCQAVSLPYWSGLPSQSQDVPS